MVDQAPETVPKGVRGTPLETEEGVEVPAQQTVGAGAVEGGGEWPDPDAPARLPAPGAVEDPDEETDPTPSSNDSRLSRLVERAFALAEDDAPEADAAAELHAAAGGDGDLLQSAERLCAEAEDGQRPETSRAAAYLAAARTI